MFVLQSTDRAFVELGPRAHLELRSLIESTMMQMADKDDEDSGQELMAQLPQILFY